MLIRIFSIVAMLGTMSPAYTSSDDSDEDSMGGEGFGSVVGFVAFLGVIVLAVIIVLAILSLTGQFESDLADPVT